MSNEPRISALSRVRLAARLWGRAPQCRPDSIEVDPLPAGSRQRLARLLAISGCITVGGCLGTGSETTAVCTAGYEDLWNNGAVCVAIDEGGESDVGCESDERCDHTPGESACAAASLCPGGCGPAAVCVAGDGIQSCARRIDARDAGRAAGGPQPASPPTRMALTRVSLR